MHEDRHHRTPKEILVELHHALQKARSHLAVAVASEKKATPLERWHFYRETDERMRRCLKELRKLGAVRLDLNRIWLDTLDALRRLPWVPNHDVARHGEAHQLCRRLSEVLTPLERSSDPAVENRPASNSNEEGTQSHSQ